MRISKSLLVAAALLISAGASMAQQNVTTANWLGADGQGGTGTWDIWKGATPNLYWGMPITATGGAAGQKVVNTTLTTGLVVGQQITGTGIPAGTTIASLVTNTSVTLSNNLTSVATGRTFNALIAGSAIASNANLTFAGPSAPAGSTTDILVDSGNVTSAAQTLTVTSSGYRFLPGVFSNRITPTGGIAGQAVINTADTSLLSLGELVNGIGIPNGSSIIAISPNASFTISQNLTQAASGTIIGSPQPSVSTFFDVTQNNTPALPPYTELPSGTLQLGSFVFNVATPGVGAATPTVTLRNPTTLGGTVLRVTNASTQVNIESTTSSTLFGQLKGDGNMLKTGGGILQYAGFAGQEFAYAQPTPFAYQMVLGVPTPVVNPSNTYAQPNDGLRPIDLAPNVVGALSGNPDRLDGLQGTITVNSGKLAVSGYLNMWHDFGPTMDSQVFGPAELPTQIANISNAANANQRTAITYALAKRMTGAASVVLNGSAVLDFTNSSVNVGANRVNFVHNLQAGLNNDQYQTTLYTGPDSTYHIGIQIDQGFSGSVGILAGPGSVYKTGAGTLTILNDANMTGMFVAAGGNTILASSSLNTFANVGSFNIAGTQDPGDANGSNTTESVLGLSRRGANVRYYEVPTTFNNTPYVFYRPSLFPDPGTTTINTDANGKYTSVTTSGATVTLASNQTVHNFQSDFALKSAGTNSISGSGSTAVYTAADAINTAANTNYKDNPIIPGTGYGSSLYLNGNILTINQDLHRDGLYTGNIYGGSTGTGGTIVKTGAGALVFLLSGGAYANTVIQQGNFIANLAGLGYAQVTIGAGGTFDILQNNTGALIANIDGAAGATLEFRAFYNIDNGSGSLIQVNSSSSIGTADIISSQPNFFGSLVVADGVGVTFSGSSNNTFINASSLTLNSTLEGQPARATLLSFADTSQIVRNLSGDSLSVIDLGRGNITLEQNNASLSYLGSITGVGSFIKQGSSTFTLVGTNATTGAVNDPYYGATIIRPGGALVAGSANAIPNTSALVLVGGASFNLNGQNQVVGSLFGSASSVVNLGSGNLNVGYTTARAATMATALAGTAPLLADYLGTTTLTSPILSAGTPTTLQATSGAAGQAVITVSSSAGLGVGQLVTGTGVPANTYVAAVNTGSFTLSQNLTQAAGGNYVIRNVKTIDVSALGLSAVQLNTLYTGGMTMPQLTSMFLSTVALGTSIGSYVVPTAASDLSFASTLSYDGTITGSGTLTFTGPETTNLNGNSTQYTGQVSVTGGTLAIQWNTFPVASGINVTSTGTLSVGVSDIYDPTLDSTKRVMAAPLTGAGSFIKTGVGYLTLTASQAGYAGTTTVSNGWLEMPLTSSTGGATIAGVNFTPTASTYAALTATGGSSGTNVIMTASTTGLVVGQAISGPGIPAGTVITSITPGVSVTLSNSLTAAASTSTNAYATAPFTFTAASGAVGQNIITTSSTAGLSVGQAIVGPGIAAGTVITAVNAGTSVTLSNNLTAAVSTTTNAYSSSIANIAANSVTGLMVGQSVSGIGIADGSIITAINAATTVTATGGTSGTNIITTTSTAGLVVGQTVTGAGVPAGTVIIGINPNASIVLSNNLTAAASTLASAYAISAEVSLSQALSGNTPATLLAPSHLVFTTPTNVVYSGAVSGAGQLEIRAAANNVTLTGGAAGQNVVTTTNTSGLFVGEYVFGPGITVGSTITAITANTNFTISNNLTAAASTTANSYTAEAVVYAGANSVTATAGLVGKPVINTSATGNLVVGQVVTGQGVQPGSVINSIFTGGSLTATGGAANQAVIALTSTAGLVVGQQITGPGVPAGAVITAITANTSITLSANLTIPASTTANAYTTSSGFVLSQNLTQSASIASNAYTAGGALTQTGGTVVRTGILYATNGWAGAPSGNITVESQGTAVLNITSNLTATGTFYGSGNIVKTGSSTLSFSQATTAFSGTYVSLAGTTNLDANNLFGGNNPTDVYAAVDLEGSSILNIMNGTTQTLRNLQGAATSQIQLSNNAQLILPVDAGQTYSFGGLFVDLGGNLNGKLVKTGLGTLSLAPTAGNNGVGYIQVLGGNLIGTVAGYNGATIQIASGATATFFADVGQSVIFNNVVTDATAINPALGGGTVAKSGAGTATLSAVGYNLNFAVQQGTLVLNDIRANGSPLLGGSIASGSTFQLNLSSNRTLGGQITGTGTLDLEAYGLANPIVSVTQQPSVSLTNIGAHVTLNASSINTITGINAAYGSYLNVGLIGSGRTLTVVQNTAGTFAGQFLGNANLNFTGTGMMLYAPTANLTPTTSAGNLASFAGAVSITGGGLAVDASNTKAIAIAVDTITSAPGRLGVYVAGGVTSAYNGAITGNAGAAQLIKLGAGTLNLTDSATTTLRSYTFGSYVVNQGVLAVTLNNQGTILPDASTASRSITLAGGTLAVQVSTTSGTLASSLGQNNSGNLAITTDPNAATPGVLTVTGAVSGNVSVDGGTTLSFGTESNRNVAISGDVNVTGGSTLAGTATISGANGLTVAAGAFVAPGYSPGVINTTNFSLAGQANMQVSATPTTVGSTQLYNDQINFSGLADLNNGGTGVLNVQRYLAANASEYGYRFVLFNGTTAQSASAPVSQYFINANPSSVVTDDATGRYVVVAPATVTAGATASGYDGLVHNTDGFVHLPYQYAVYSVRAPSEYAVAGVDAALISFIQSKTNVAAGTVFVPGVSGTIDPLSARLMTMTNAQLTPAIQSLQPAIFGAIPNTVVLGIRSDTEAIEERLEMRRYDRVGFTVNSSEAFVQASSMNFTGSSSAGEVPYNATLTGGLAGMSFDINSWSVYGFSVGYSQVKANTIANASLGASSSGTLSGNEFRVTGFFSTMLGEKKDTFFLDLGVSFGSSSDKLSRTTFLGTENSSPTATSYGAFARLGTGFATKSGFNITPYVGLDYNHVAGGAFTETGDTTALSARSISYDSARASLGTGFTWLSIVDGETMKFTFDVQGFGEMTGGKNATVNVDFTDGATGGFNFQAPVGTSSGFRVAPSFTYGPNPDSSYYLTLSFEKAGSTGSTGVELGYRRRF
jgi:autotransporter-associated beta strand protein